MNDHAKGIIQLIVVVIFIMASFTVSGLLQTGKGERVNDKQDKQSRALFVDVQTVSPAPYKIKFKTTGTIQARANVAITSQVSGRLTKISDQMFAGGTFKANEILFEVDARDFRNDVQRLQAEVSRTATALELEKAESAVALNEWQLLKGNTPAPDLVARKPQMQEARADLNAAKAQLQTARLNLQRTKFSLPFDGRILSSELELGQFITAGQNYGSAYDESTLEISALLQDHQLQWLLKAKTPHITITTTYLGNKTRHQAKIKRANAALNTQTQFAQVVFDFIDPPTGLISGLFADIEIEGQELKDITLLPAQALQKGEVIWRVLDDMTLQSIAVTPAYMDDRIIALDNIDGAIMAVISRLSGANEGTQVSINAAPAESADNNNPHAEGTDSE